MTDRQQTKECKAQNCAVRLFDPDEDYCQHHEALHIFDTQYGTKTAPPDKHISPEEKSWIADMLRKFWRRQ